MLLHEKPVAPQVEADVAGVHVEPPRAHPLTAAAMAVSIQEVLPAPRPGKDKEKKPDDGTPKKLRPAGGPNRR